MTEIKNMLKEIYPEGEVNAMEIFKGWTVETGLSGWHSRSFGRNERHFMGTSVAEVREYVDEIKATREVVPWMHGSVQ